MDLQDVKDFVAMGFAAVAVLTVVFWLGYIIGWYLLTKVFKGGK